MQRMLVIDACFLGKCGGKLKINCALFGTRRQVTDVVVLNWFWLCILARLNRPSVQ